MLAEAVIKTTRQGPVRFGIACPTGRDMLDVGNLAAISGLVSEIVEKGSGIHYHFFTKSKNG